MDERERERWADRASELLSERRPCGKSGFMVTYFDNWDVTALLDERPAEIREPHWIGFRNLLYGWECEILAEAISPDYAVMLLDAARDMDPWVAQQCSLLASRPSMDENRRRMEERGLRVDEPVLLWPNSRWGRVVVENGKPIGLLVDGKVVRQPIDKSWQEYGYSP